MTLCQRLVGVYVVSGAVCALAGCGAPYDIKWSAGPVPPRVSAGHAVTISPTGPVLLGGVGSTAADGMLAFDPKKRNWLAAPGPVAVDPAFAPTADGVVLVGGLIRGEPTAECAAYKVGQTFLSVADRQTGMSAPPQSKGSTLPARTALPPLPEPRVAAAAAVVDRVVYVLLGAERVDRPGHDSAEMFRLDLDRPRSGWVPMGDVPGGPCRHAAAVSLGGRVFVFGGVRHDRDGKRVALADVRRFDPRLDLWNTMSALPEPLFGLGAVAIDGRYILLLGGAGQNNADIPAGRPQLPYRIRAWIYDTAADVYHPIDDLPRAVIRSPPVIHEGNVYIAGGEPRPGEAIPALMIGELTPARPAWWK